MMDNQTILFNIEKCDRDIDKLGFFLLYFQGDAPEKAVKLSTPGGTELMLSLFMNEETEIVKMIANRLEAQKARRAKLVKDLYYGAT